MRETIDLNNYQELLTTVFDESCNVGTKTAKGAGVRIGGSATRGNISQYKYINTKKVLLENQFKKCIDNLTSTLNIKNSVITHNILHFTPGDFLDWQDYYMWEKKSQVVGSMHIIGPVIKFFSIALTDDCSIEFKDQLYNIPKHTGIVFELNDVHRVLPVNSDQRWLVLGVAKHIDIISQINC